MLPPRSGVLKFLQEGKIRSLHDLELAIHGGAVKRIRPETMTILALLLGLMPMMIGAETGAGTMKRLAAPMIGGVLTSFAMELLVYPVVYYLYKRWEVLRIMRNADAQEEPPVASPG